MTDLRGPYMNEDGDWWVPIEDGTFREARVRVVGCLSYDIPGDGTLVYVGKTLSTLCDADHEVGPECDATCSRTVLAYYWKENRRW
jgi:hypothetical protein